MTPCHYCDRPAAYLCDFLLRGGRTCDRPLCEAHRHFRGAVFFCGEEGGLDSRDFCPGHARGPEFQPPYRPVGGGRAG
jgi:hypothetical protein